MLVAFDFICTLHGKFEKFFNTKDFPDRKFPREIYCHTCFALCQVSDSCNMSPDQYWSGKYVPALDMEITSKSYLKRHCKTLGMTQLTDEEVKTTKRKSKSERINEYINRPDIVKERTKIISESIDQYGVIDSVNMEK